MDGHAALAEDHAGLLPQGVSNRDEQLFRLRQPVRAHLPDQSGLGLVWLAHLVRHHRQHAGHVPAHGPAAGERERAIHAGAHHPTLHDEYAHDGHVGLFGCRAAGRLWQRRLVRLLDGHHLRQQVVRAPVHAGHRRQLDHGPQFCRFHELVRSGFPARQQLQSGLVLRAYHRQRHRHGLQRQHLPNGRNLHGPDEHDPAVWRPARLHTLADSGRLPRPCRGVHRRGLGQLEVGDHPAHAG